MEICGVILSAGKSARMGIPKALVKIGRRTFLEIIFTNMKKAGVKNIHIVVGKDEQLIRKETKLEPLGFLINPDFNAEQFSSIRLAMEYLKEKASAIMFALVDHPLVKFETYKKLLDSAKKMENKILIPSYNHKAGHPIVITKNAYRLFLQSDKQTAREVIQEHKELIKYMNVDDENILININTKDGLVIKKSM